MFTKITNVEVLNKVLATSEYPIDFRVSLNSGLYSKKTISRLDDGTYYILNGVDDSEDVYTEKDLFDLSMTVIGVAMERGNFYAEGDFNSLVENIAIEEEIIRLYKACTIITRVWLKSMKKDKKLLDRRPKARRRIFKGMYIKSLENDGKRLQLPRTQQLLSSKHMLTPKEIRHIKLASKKFKGVSELL